MTIRVTLKTPEFAVVPGGISNATRNSSFVSTIVSSVMAISAQVIEASGDAGINTTCELL